MTETLILDLTSEFRQFREAVKPLVDNFDKFARESVGSILQYVFGASNGESMLAELGEAVEEAAREDGQRSDEEVETVRDAVVELGHSILKHLIAIGAYDSNDQLAFKLKDIQGDDIILTPLTPEDIAKIGDDDDGDVEDPNALAQDLAENDRDNLYAPLNDGFSTDDESYEDD